MAGKRANAEVRLTDDDFDRIEASMVNVVKQHVPIIMGEKLVELGLDIAVPASRLDIQRDMAFLRKLRQGTELAAGTALKRAVHWLVGVIGALIIAGLFWYVNKTHL